MPLTNAPLRFALIAQGQTAIVPCAGQAYVAIGISGVWSGLLTFQVTYDGTTWVPSNVIPYPVGTSQQTTTGNGTWYQALLGDHGPALGYRVVWTTRTSGTAVVEMAASGDLSALSALEQPEAIY